MAIPLRVCLLLLLAACKTRAQVATATVTPAGFNASLGSISTFECEVFSADDIGWIVDGFSTTRPEVTNRNITASSPVEVIDAALGQLRSILTIPATLANSNITVQCEADVLQGGVDQLSAEVRYFVQGILDPPSNLQISSVPSDDAQRVLTWDVPETLDITLVEDDIMGYTVCNNISDMCSSTTEAQYTFPNLRVPLEFTVTALNIVGESLPSTAIVHEACDPDTEPSSIDSGDVETMVYFEASDPKLQLTFNQNQQPGQDENCSDVFLVEASPVSGGNATNSGVIIPSLVEGEGGRRRINIVVDFSLQSNLVYTAVIVSRNINGDQSSTGTITFTTYDVQALQVSSLPGSIEITCTFAQGSEALGCHITIATPAGMQLRINASRDINMLQSQTATHTEMNLDVGTYTISVFDLESDSTIGTSTATEAQEVSISEMQPTTVPSAATTPVRPTQEPELPSSDSTIIIGAVVGSLVGAFGIGIVLLVTCLACSLVRRHRDRGIKDETLTDNWDDTDGSLRPPIRQNPSLRQPAPPTQQEVVYEEPTTGIIRKPSVLSEQIKALSTEDKLDAPPVVNPVYQEIPEGRRSKSASSYLQQQQRQSSVEQNGRSYRLSIPPPIPSQHLSVDDIRDLDLTPDTVAIVRASQEELHSTSAGKNAAAAVELQEDPHHPPDDAAAAAAAPNYEDIVVVKAQLSGSQQLSSSHDYADPLPSSASSRAHSSNLLGVPVAKDPQYAQIEVDRKAQEGPVRDKTGVLYSEIKVEALAPVLPQKRTKKHGSELERLRGGDNGSQDHSRESSTERASSLAASTELLITVTTD